MSLRRRTSPLDQLIFHRSSGKVFSKFGSEGFLEELKNNPFESRVPEGISVTLLEDRVLVTLVIVARLPDPRMMACCIDIATFVCSPAQVTDGLWSFGTN